MAAITLDQADRLVEEALAEGARRGLKPLTVAVVDAGGHLVALARQDGASILRPAIAQAKATVSLELGVSSRRIGEMAAERPTFVASLGSISAHGIVPAAGGLAIMEADGSPIGAIGITGDTSDNDELCALAAIEAIGLSTQV